MKRGSRVLGITETSLEKVFFVGVVTSGSLLEDVAFSVATRGGLDATEAVIRLRKRLRREDLRLILLSGRIVGGYNIIDLERLYKESRIPVVALPYYRPRKDIRRIIKRLFSDYERRLEIYERNIRFAAPIEVGRKRLAIIIGIEPKEVERFLNKILIGKTPYPIYFADRIARGFRKSVADILRKIRILLRGVVKTLRSRDF